MYIFCGNRGIFARETLWEALDQVTKRVLSSPFQWYNNCVELQVYAITTEERAMDKQLAKRRGFTLTPRGADKHTRHQLGKFSEWLDARGLNWYEPDVAAYRDHLLAQGYRPSTVRAHLSTLQF